MYHLVHEITKTMHKKPEEDRKTLQSVSFEKLKAEN